MRLKIYSIIAILLLSICFDSCKDNQTFHKINNEGQAFGTTYHITYFDSDQQDFSKAMDSLFHLINKSLSTYIPTSDISKINNGDTTVIVDTYFKEVFEKSNRIYQETEGIFDPTIGILVNAWGFGPEEPLQKLDSVKVKHLLNLVGFDHVKLQNGNIIKFKDSVYLDFNAIAKGYAVDVASRFLEAKNIDDYLVEIGGELRSKGINKAKNTPWKVGIENPNFDGSRSIEKVLELNNEAMATSGNYRKFNVDSITGKKYAHIINSKTGYPTQSSLLSVSVIAQMDCADVDGYATAIMAMPFEKAKSFLAGHTELKGYIIYSDEKGVLNTYATSNFQGF